MRMKKTISRVLVLTLLACLAPACTHNTLKYAGYSVAAAGIGTSIAAVRALSACPTDDILCNYIDQKEDKTEYAITIGVGLVAAVLGFLMVDLAYRIKTHEQ